MTSANPKNDTGDDQQQQQESLRETQSKEQDQTVTFNNNENNQKDDDENDDNNDTKTTTMEETAKRRRNKKVRRMVRILLVLPYIAGIVWTCLHPIVSVITGELKCRGWYLDEHSIETRFTVGQNPRMVPVHLTDNVNVAPLRSNADADADAVPYSLCDFFDREGDPDFNDRNNNLICYEHGDYFDMAMIMPLSNAIDASEEAVVLVVPRPSDVYQSSLGGEEGGTLDWNSSIFHQAMIRSIKHLADPVETPWLAKAVLVVTPTMSSRGGIKSSNQSLDETVSSFLDAYSGQQTISRDYQTKRQEEHNDGKTTIPQLPPRLSGAILRNLVVLEVFDESSSTASSSTNNRNVAVGSTDLSILPQGRRGVLPNADLVFLVGKLMEKTQFYLHANTKTFLTHPYTQESKKAESWINRWIDIGSEFLAGSNNKEWTTNAKTWAKGMIDVSLFAKTLAVGPYPPHSPALERGIDSLTIRASFEGTFRRDPSVELVQHSEYIVRSLANLHERLHHSFTLYLLPTPKAFVSHIEYLLPNVLVLLPLVVRVFGIILPNMTRGLDLTALGGVLLTVLAVVVTMFLTAIVTDGEATMAVVFVLLYTGVAVFWIRNILLRNHHRQCQSDVPDDPSCQHTETKEGGQNQDRNPETTRTILTLQFATCAVTVYILVPIAFAHASLSYLPSVLWTPLLAFPDYPSMKNSSSSNNAARNSGFSHVQRFVVIPVLSLVVVATAPPLVLVPGMFSTYTPFVRYVYTPIHVLFFLLVTSIVAS
jgi:glycosylphosphatidylinositol transamidase